MGAGLRCLRARWRPRAADLAGRPRACDVCRRHPGSFAINNSIKTLDDVPLFISESTTQDKLKTIRSSDYLSFCYEQLLSHNGALCIFGHSLGEQDSHIVHALRQAKLTTIAFSIYPRSKAFIQHQKRHYTKLFEGMDVTLRFFDSKSHGLGSAQLSVPVER